MDITPLSRLPNTLQTLDLAGNRISNIYALVNLPTSLSTLDLGYNNIEDITPLSNLPPHLHELLLNDNRIVDVSPLANLPQRLSTLILRLNRIETISSLANLPPTLTQLYLNDNRIQDFSIILAQACYMEQLDFRLDGNPGFDQLQVEKMTKNRKTNRKILTLMSGISVSRINRGSSLRQSGIKNLTDVMRGVSDLLNE